MPSASTTVRPALAGILLLIAVAVTAYVLYLWWPAGVAVGVALGAGAVLAVGARMQSSAARVLEDDELVDRLGMAEPVPVAAVAAPAGAAEPAAPVLHAQPDDAWFSTEPEDAAPVVEPAAPAVAVAVAEPEPDAEPEPAAEPEPVAEPEPEPEPEPVAVAVPVDDAPDVIPSTDFELTEDDDSVRTDLERLKAELGDGYLDFARAARLVVSTQYASAARLQRDLDVPYSRARRLISDLEEQHFIGPKTGSLPRVVLLPKERLPEVERLLADA